jgi:hypothetical protein
MVRALAILQAQKRVRVQAVLEQPSVKRLDVIGFCVYQLGQASIFRLYVDFRKISIQVNVPVGHGGPYSSWGAAEMGLGARFGTGLYSAMTGLAPSNTGGVRWW